MPVRIIYRVAHLVPVRIMYRVTHIVPVRIIYRMAHLVAVRSICYLAHLVPVRIAVRWINTCFISVSSCFEPLQCHLLEPVEGGEIGHGNHGGGPGTSGEWIRDEMPRHIIVYQ